MAKDPSQYEKLGRPSTYTEELAEEICRRISNDEALTDICAEKGMPDRNTVFRWLKLHDNFAASYDEARQRQGHAVYDKLSKLESEVLDGTVDPQAANVVLRSRQWRAARMAPKNYSDKVINQHVGPDGGAIKVESTVIDPEAMTPEERKAMKAILLAAQARKEASND